MTGMGEMPDGRPLTLGGCPGEGDEGRLLYIQHTDGAETERDGDREEHKHFHSEKANPVCVFIHNVILLFKWLL